MSDQSELKEYIARLGATKEDVRGMRLKVMMRF